MTATIVLWRPIIVEPNVKVMSDFVAARAVEAETVANLIALGLTPGNRCYRCADATWLVRKTSSWSNVAAGFKFSEGTANKRLKAIIATYRRAGYGTGVWLGPSATPADLPERMKALGMRCNTHYLGMAYDLRQSPRRFPHPSGLQIRLLKDHSCFRRVPHPFIGPMTTDNRRHALLEHETLVSSRSQKSWEIVAWMKDRPVGAALICQVRNVVGFHDVGVLPEYRRQGIGMALMTEGLKLARQRKARFCTLIAGGMGKGMYLRIGFKEVCKMSYWWRRKNR